VPNDGDERSGAVLGVRRRAELAGAIVATVVALDQATKVWAVAALSDGPVQLVGDDVELALSRNTGGAFSLFRDFTPFLVVFAAVITVVLIRAIRRAPDLLTVAALALVVGGATGNLLDRVFRSPRPLHGAVVDFISFGTFPSFNVADSAITAGAIGVVLRAWRAGDEPDAG